jgi:hypothetical protein
MTAGALTKGAPAITPAMAVNRVSSVGLTSLAAHMPRAKATPPGITDFMVAIPLFDLVRDLAACGSIAIGRSAHLKHCALKLAKRARIASRSRSLFGESRSRGSAGCSLSGWSPIRRILQPFGMPRHWW